MAQLLIRQLDDALKERLRRRAEGHGVSMEAEARTILRDSLLRDRVKATGGFGSRAAALFAVHGLREDESLPEVRWKDRPAVDFE